MVVDLQRQERARRNVPAGARELQAVEAGESVRHDALPGLPEEELSLEELDIAASQYAIYITNLD